MTDRQVFEAWIRRYFGDSAIDRPSPEMLEVVKFGYATWIEAKADARALVGVNGVHLLR